MVLASFEELGYNAVTVGFPLLAFGSILVRWGPIFSLAGYPAACCGGASCPGVAIGAGISGTPGC